MHQNKEEILIGDNIISNFKKNQEELILTFSVLELVTEDIWHFVFSISM
jgi:hypothetical protein